MLHIVNLSINQNCFAGNWKKQLVLPLHKKNDPMEGENYRPVSHITEISKIVEYIVHQQVFTHFLQEDLFHENHHGFIRNCSTATAVAQLFDMWLEASEKGELSAALLLDLSAAFDIIDHKIFLEKLRCYGFSENVICWFRSYLSGRSNIVQVESQFSDPKMMEDYGIPQGSILGPLVFIIFSNDFPASCETGEAVMFADDDTENVHDSDVEELKQKIQKEANNATEWVNDNKMVCAGNKTKLLLIGTPQLKHKKFEEHTNFSIDVDGTAVTNSESEPLLGLVVNDRLNWSNYVRGSDSKSGLIAQLSKRIGLLKRVVKVMPTARFRQVANGLFHSKLVYCLHVFGNVWGLADQDDQNRKCSTFTKSDN